MNFKKIFFCLCMGLILFLTLALNASAKEDGSGKTLEITLPLEEISKNEYCYHLTEREYFVYQFFILGSIHDNIFYNPETNQPLFERHTIDQGIYFTPYEGTAENDFTFIIPDEWRDNVFSPTLLNGYNKIKINFDVILSEAIDEIVLDFPEVTSFLELPFIGVYSLEMIMYEENTDYPIAIVEDGNRSQFINRESNKILAVINDDTSITIPDDVSYEDNTTFIIKKEDIGYENDIKISFIFGEAPENDESNISVQDGDNINKLDTNPTTYRNKIILFILCGCIISIANLFKVRKKSK